MLDFSVQRIVNDFQTNQSWLDSGPSLFYVFFAGAISDHFGRKPLIFFPLLGTSLLNKMVEQFVQKSLFRFADSSHI